MTDFDDHALPVDLTLHPSRRRFLAASGVAALSFGLGWPFGRAAAQEVTFFRIGTGSTSGTYFPVGGLIASVISHPPGSRPCNKGGSCGYEGLIGVAVSTQGSVANVEGMASGGLESGLAQADIALWAFNGSGLFAESGAHESLRSIANLYTEALHLVVRRSIRIRTVQDLKGKRVSLDQEGSGTRVDAELLLRAYGLTIDDIEASYLNVDQAVEKLRAGELDAFFLVAGTPANAIRDLAMDVQVDLVPIEGPEAEKLQEEVPFFAPTIIDAGIYSDVAATHTLGVGAQWFVNADIAEDVVYQSTFALWHENARRLLDNGHPKAALIQLDTALQGLGVPLHPGAERFYREIGLIGAPGDGNGDDGSAAEETPAEETPAEEVGDQ